jgi:lipoprotein NlpI
MRIAQNLRSSMGDRELFPASDALQQTYARILSHLASAPVPNPVLAQDVFRAAQRQLTLDPEWKVYFALWTKLIAARAGKPADDEVSIVLNQYKRAADWHGQLARFGVGEMTYEQLLAAADGPGQQTEAHFYAAAGAMARNDAATAARLLDLAVKLRMVNYYEFTMAQDLLRQKR